MADSVVSVRPTNGVSFAVNREVTAEDEANGAISFEFAAGFPLAAAIQVIGHASVEIVDIIAAADVSKSLAGKYFNINSRNEAFYVWFQVGAGETWDGVDPEVSNRTGILVQVAEDATASTVAAAVRAALKETALVDDFSITGSGTHIIVRTLTVGTVPDATAGDSGFTVGTPDPQGAHDTNVQLALTGALITFPADGKVRIANGGSFALKQGQLLSLIAQRARLS